MTYTEIKKRNLRKYYYRVKSVRVGKNVKKERKYLGVNLNNKELEIAENKADKELIFLQNILTFEDIKFLEKLEKDHNQESKGNFQNRYESFCALFTYNSNAIEGNTLTLQETAQLLFEERTPRKSLREINEALNHKQAFDYILKYKKDITKDFIFNIHNLVVKNTLKSEMISQIGKYRNLQVFIRGAEFIPPKPNEIINEMKNLLSWYSKNKNKLHPLIIASYFHINFESIHPFIDGNGRVGRLLLNFILHKNKFPMINIPSNMKHKYYTALEEAQMKLNLRPFIDFSINLLKNNQIRF
tara:strand:+ start:1803 stop:2702 length:900 start_codon:yes stop_codon:yes gene_type:complete